MTAVSRRLTFALLVCISTSTISSCKARNASTLRANTSEDSQELTSLLASLDANLAQLEATLAAKSSSSESTASSAQLTTEDSSPSGNRQATQLTTSSTVPDKDFEFECADRDTECELAVIAVKLDYLTQKIQSSGQLLSDRTVADRVAQLLPQSNQVAAATAFKSSPLSGTDGQSAVALTEETPPNISSLISSIKSVRSAVQSLDSRAKAEDLRIRREEHGKYVNDLWQSYQEALKESNRQINLGNAANNEANALINERNQLVNMYNAGADRAVSSSGSTFSILPRTNSLARQIDSQQSTARSYWDDGKYYKERAAQLYKDWQQAQRNYPQK